MVPDSLVKTCTVCKTTTSLDNFHNRKRSPDGKGYRCKSCDYLARRKWADDNPERSSLSSRRRQLKYNYGITLEDYDGMFCSQNGKCAVCGTAKNMAWHGNNLASNFSVDHDHSSGTIRGLLCNNCNRALGLLNDDPKVLRRGADYLEKHLRNENSD